MDEAQLGGPPTSRLSNLSEAFHRRRTWQRPDRTPKDGELLQIQKLAGSNPGVKDPDEVQSGHDCHDFSSQNQQAFPADLKTLAGKPASFRYWAAGEAIALMAKG